MLKPRVTINATAFDRSDALHHDALMRTTVDLPDNLHRIALGLAHHTGRSLSQAVAELMQRGLAARPAGEPDAIDAKTGLPTVRSSRPITGDDVKAIEDEA